jgi:hypothetical protein
VLVFEIALVVMLFGMALALAIKTWQGPNDD